MSTLERVLEIRKSRDNQVSHDDILHLPVIAIAATDNNIIAIEIDALRDQLEQGANFDLVGPVTAFKKFPIIL